MSKLAEFLKSHASTANPANPHQKISNPSNISSGVCEDENSFANLPGVLETRIRAAAERRGFTPEELAEELALAAADRAKALQWVEHDEAQTVPLSPLSPAQEAARREVLAQLETHPSVERGFVNRFDADGTLVVTLAIRGVGTGELLIPADRFYQGSLENYGALLACIEGAARLVES